MKNLIYTLIITSVIVGCQSTFESKDQAKNKVNEQGYRIGRWVDYLDSTGRITNNTSNYWIYVLSEFEEGKPVGNFKNYRKDNSLYASGSYYFDGTLFTKDTCPSRVEGEIIYYGKDHLKDLILERRFYKSNGDISKSIIYIYDEKPFLTDSILITNIYYRENFLKEREIRINDRLDLIKIEYLQAPSAKIEKEDPKKLVSFYSEDYLKYINGLIDSWFGNDSSMKKIDKEVKQILSSSLGGLDFYRVGYFTDFSGKKSDFQESVLWPRYSQWVKSKEPKPTITQNQSGSSSSRGQMSISCIALSDNPYKYIGQTITVSLGYLSTLNESYGLRSQSISDERALAIYLGVYDDNDKYYTRIADCNQGSNFYLRIPFSLGNSVPNISSGYMKVTGILKSSQTIIVSSITRGW